MRGNEENKADVQLSLTHIRCAAVGKKRSEVGSEMNEQRSIRQTNAESNDEAPALHVQRHDRDCVGV
jgi:hypothetical protein